MISYRVVGTQGEQEVVDLVLCPNCSNKLMLLPQNYPMYDLQCSACNFRAQVKTCNSNPSKVRSIRGAGWDIMEKVLRAGFLIPPLIVNFKWLEGKEEKQEIRFYPFVRKFNLKKRVANIKSHNRIYNVFDYDLKGLIFDKLYSK